ncbi:MAG TPA: HAD family phosphatase [Pyrinomonadaceae bacterium]|jgi:HAD superfamily hydrolase (TIGR01509 family)
MIKALLFDFNGVIIDDEALQMKAYQEAFAPLGMTLTEEEYYGSLGTDDVAFVRAAFERAAQTLDDETLQSIIERKSELHRVLIEDELPLFPGVLTFIKAAARRYTLGLASMARRAEIDHVLQRAGLDQSFAAIVSAEDVRACKPDPFCYRRALELLNEKLRGAGQPTLAPEECLVIEDAPPGIEAGRAAGMRTLGVTNTVSEEALRRAGADVVTPRLSDWTTDAVHHVFDRETMSAMSHER